MNINYLGTEAQSKNELYRMLTVEAKLYLPPQKETSIYFIRGILNGTKKVTLYYLALNKFRHIIPIVSKYVQCHLLKTLGLKT